jgi:hypothetical protein
MYLEWRKINKNRMFLDKLSESGRVIRVRCGLLFEDGC